MTVALELRTLSISEPVRKVSLSLHRPSGTSMHGHRRKLRRRLAPLYHGRYNHASAVARKRSRSFCQKWRWQVTPKHVYTFAPAKSEWADNAAVQAQCGNLSGNELTRNLSGNIRPQSSQLAELLWTGPDLKSGTSVHGLFSTFKTTKAQAGNEWSNILPKSSQTRKKKPTITPIEAATGKEGNVGLCVHRNH